jgi:phosphoserine phosphatase
MNGKMDFDESLRLRVAKLKGMPQADLLEVFQKIKLTPGAEELLRVLKKLGYKIALISGGFMFVAERLKTQLGIDYVYANALESNQGVLTGNVLPPIVNAQRKADLLDVIAQQENIELDQVIAIGDGANDILMLEKAGLGIAFNAKPTVREKADLAISQKNLKSVLYLLGLAVKDLSVCFKTDTLR